MDKAIKVGANIGYQSAELLKEEKATLKPIKIIVNEAYTKQLRNSTLEINMGLLKHQVEHYMEVTKRKIDELLECARSMYKDISENEEFMKLSHKLRKRKERYQKWIQIMDHNNLVKNTVKAWFGKQISDHTDDKWYTWQCARLWCAYCLDWSHKKSLPGSCEKKDISNDFYDIEPVLYLLRADGLLTNDQKLEIPLTKAAYPQKEVFQVDTSLNASRTVQHLFHDIISKVPTNYKN